MNQLIESVELKPGVRVTGELQEYELQDELGKGGFGTVFRARDSQRNVALKIVKMWSIMPNERQEYATRLRQEFEIARSIDSEHVVKSLDYANYRGNPFIVMELCDGGSMRSKFENATEKEGTQLAIGILKGLRDLHAQGIIHRDIKPENILLNHLGKTKLVDFGISGSIKKRHTQPNIMGYVKAVFATLNYSPPEQTDASKAFSTLGPTNDIYAFGVTMYEYFTRGQFPFGDFDEYREDFKAFDKRKRENRWDKDTLEQAIQSSTWHNIIETCMQANPEKRYKSCEEIRCLLDAANCVVDNRDETISIGPHHQWLLQIMQGDEPGRSYNLTAISRNMQQTELTVGWFNPETPYTNTIGLAENFTTYISKRHATLTLNDSNGYWYIQDGQRTNDNGMIGWKLSTNGVLVNSDRIGQSEYRLLPNDIITLGDTTLKVILLE